MNSQAYDPRCIAIGLAIQNQRNAKELRSVLLKRQQCSKTIRNACSKVGMSTNRSYYLESNKHEVRTLEVNKLALNSQDDKRISIDLDGIASYATGHHRV